MNSKSENAQNAVVVIGTIFFVVTATFIIGWITYIFADEYMRNSKLTKETVETKFDELEARLESLKATRNVTVAIRVMTNTEKNRLWWRIAKVATKTGGASTGRSTNYSLNHAQASIVAEEYRISVSNVFEFFRNNSGAPWRSAIPPGNEEEEEPILR